MHDVYAAQNNYARGGTYRLRERDCRSASSSYSPIDGETGFRIVCEVE